MIRLHNWRCRDRCKAPVMMLIRHRSGKRMHCSGWGVADMIIEDGSSGGIGVCQLGFLLFSALLP